MNVMPIVRMSAAAAGLARLQLVDAEASTSASTSAAAGRASPSLVAQLVPWPGRRRSVVA